MGNRSCQSWRDLTSLLLLIGLLLASGQAFDASDSDCMSETLIKLAIPAARALVYAGKLAQLNATVASLHGLNDVGLQVVGISNGADRHRVYQCFFGSAGRNKPCARSCGGHGECQPATQSSVVQETYTCHCEPGFVGRSCELNSCLRYSDVSRSEPRCQNGGQCTRTRTEAGFSCSCGGGYTGEECESVRDHCQPNPCRHGGKCQNAINSFSCHCSIGYTGKLCNQKWLTEGRQAQMVSTLFQRISEADAVQQERISRLSSMVATLTHAVAKLQGKENANTQAQQTMFSSLSALGNSIQQVVQTHDQFVRQLHPTYKLFRASVTWQQARANCKAKGGALASPKSGRDFRTLVETTGMTSGWLGGNDASTEGRWVWEDRSIIDYGDWRPGRPNGGRRENCLALFYESGRYYWNDERCPTPLSYVCEF